MRRSVLLAIVGSLAPAVGAAQNDSTAFICDGRVVARVNITTERPPFSGTAAKWRAAAHAIGLHHATTRRTVIEAFLSLAPGTICTEFRRSESERVLRAQPFLSQAVVRVAPDTGIGVVVEVTTTDEAPVLVSGRFRGLRPESFSLGNENVGGLALRVEGRIENGGSYRTEFGGRMEQDALVGHPYRLVLDGARYQIGHRLVAEVEHPLFTDLQRISWHAGIIVTDDYPRFERVDADQLALQASDRSWGVSSLLRVFGTHTVTLLGGAIDGRRFEPATRAVIVQDTGVAPDTSATLRGRYPSFEVGRIGITGGVRRVTFQTVSGFDALVGSQDVARGAMLGGHIAHGLPQFGERDLLISGALYAGAASANALLATLAQLEGRRDAASTWNSVIGSARTALYWGSAPGLVLVVDDQLSAGRNSRLPLQLSFRDYDYGLPGYRNSGLAGALRNVARAELRVSGESLVREADIGLAAFVQNGLLRAGDVPFGVDATRTTLGISVLGAYPSRSKRLYRADLAFPLTRSGRGAGGVEVRFSSFDRTQGFWTEPDDVTRARTGTNPSRLFAWPQR